MVTAVALTVPSAAAGPTTVTFTPGWMSAAEPAAVLVTVVSGASSRKRFREWF